MIDVYVRANIHEAVADKIQDVCKEEWGHQTRIDFMAYCNTNGKHGKLPQRVTKQMFSDLLKLVLLSPPDWVDSYNSLPDTPEERLKLYPYVMIEME
jgi:hypothetical protein